MSLPCRAVMVVVAALTGAACGDDPGRRAFVATDTRADGAADASGEVAADTEVGPDSAPDTSAPDSEAPDTFEPPDTSEPPDTFEPPDTSETSDTADTSDTTDTSDTEPEITDEPIGAGWSGGQCETDGDCGPVGSTCIPDVGGGSCSIACDELCDDAPGAPVTFCIAAEDYESRMDTALPGELAGGLCVAKCDFLLFPRSGCRDGLHCELHTRHEQLVEDEVCVPGPWSVGLRLSGDGMQVLGRDEAGPEPAEPWATLVGLTCGGAFGSIPAHLFRGLAETLLAMGPDGRGRSWERLCTPPAGLPTWYGLHDQAGRAFRLTGTRLEIVDWVGYALYGHVDATGFRVGGPLYPSRVMVYRSGTTQWLYADGADDHPHPDPEAGRHFGSIEGDEWAPLESVAEPDIEYKPRKAASIGRFQRQWARRETVEFLAEMAVDHLIRHGVMLGIGDVSLATGGDIDDHSSHEVGLDVDIYMLTFPPDPTGEPDPSRPIVWVADCDGGGDAWDCWYYDAATGDLEDPNAPLHVSAVAMLTSLAQFALDHDGPAWFVQHDVVTLAPFRALGGSEPRFVDATNDSETGWPAHHNHVHVRFYDW